MINEIIIKGSPETTYHDFTFSTNGMVLIISGGTYYRNNEILFSDNDGGLITIPTTSNMNYEIYLMENGEMHILQYFNVDDAIEFHSHGGIIDKLAWFTIGENVTSLEDVQINVVKSVMSDAS